jgi:preprotein translocase subunit SecD
VAPPSGSASRPGRHLAVLAAIIVVLLLAIVGADIAAPAKWHRAFQVHLGLDLTSGTTVSLKAVPVHGSTVTPAEMQTAQQIMFNRVNSAGFTEAQVVPQGTNIMTVSVPGQNSQKVVQLVSQTAELLFRQVVLVAPNAATPTPTASPTPSGTASPTPSPSASPQATSSSTAQAKAKASPTASTSAFVEGGRVRTNRTAELTSSASRLGAAAQAKASPTPTPSATPASSASSTPAATPSPVPTVTSPNGTSTWQQASGDASLVSAHVKALFDKVNCASGNWAKAIGYSPAIWDNPKLQIVACGLSGGTTGVPFKYVLAPANVLGSQIKSASATPQTSSTFWQVNLNFNGAGAKAFGDLTSAMYAKYHGSQVPQNEVAVVLDGKVISAPNIISAIVGGQAQITGNFNQQQSTSLANVLSYGSLPLTFHQEAVETITPQLGHDQLNAGLLAGAIGLLLVVCYLLLYYRGLAIVAVSSLAIAALLTYLAVVVLGKYQGFALSLAGIAGLIVAVGITADSFVVFFERLRDEVREGGKSLRAAVEHGWGRARRTILVSDTVSFLAAALLYYFSIGDVKGFAFTLGLSTIIDLVVVFTFTKPVMTLLARTKFFGGGHPWSGLDPVRLGARAPWRGTPRTPVRPRSARPATAKEA